MNDSLPTAHSTVLPNDQSDAHAALTRGIRLPPHYEEIARRAEELDFDMNSDVLTGALLRGLAATRPEGNLLELGTGCGLGTAWLLDGMGASAALTSIDTDARVQAVARAAFSSDSRVTFHRQDGAEFLTQCRDRFDVIYADAWPGKFEHLTAALGLLVRGGVYVIDDLLPQPNWPDGHATKVVQLVESLSTLPGYRWIPFAWSTGVGLLIKI